MPHATLLCTVLRYARRGGKSSRADRVFAVEQPSIRPPRKFSQPIRYDRVRVLLGISVKLTLWRSEGNSITQESSNFYLQFALIRLNSLNYVMWRQFTVANWNSFLKIHFCGKNRWHTEKQISLTQEPILRAAVDICCWFSSIFIVIIVNKIGSITEKIVKTRITSSTLNAIVRINKALKYRQVSIAARSSISDTLFSVYCV